MENNVDVLQRFGGRKFVLALILIIAIVALASLSPASLTTEVVVALLGVLATFSGSNAFLSRLTIRGSQGPEKAIAQEETQATEQDQESIVTENQSSFIENKIMELERRLSQTEITQSEVIEIVKQQQNAIITLTKADKSR